MEGGGGRRGKRQRRRGDWEGEDGNEEGEMGRGNREEETGRGDREWETGRGMTGRRAMGWGRGRRRGQGGGEISQMDMMGCLGGQRL